MDEEINQIKEMVTVKSNKPIFSISMLKRLKDRFVDRNREEILDLLEELDITEKRSIVIKKKIKHLAGLSKLLE